MEMINDFILNSTLLTGVLLSLLGGMVFGGSLMYLRPRKHAEAARDFIKRVLTFMFLFYITFPFVQGVSGLYEHHDPSLLTEVTVYYAIFMAGIVLICSILKKVGGDRWK